MPSRELVHGPARSGQSAAIGWAAAPSSVVKAARRRVFRILWHGVEGDHLLVTEW